MGVPTIKPGAEIMAVQFHAPRDEIAALDKLACSQRINRSKLIRHLIKQAIDRPANNP